MNNDELFFRATMALSTARLYDALLVLIANLAGEDAAVELLELHQAGQLYYPPPKIRIDKVEDVTD